MTWWYLSFADPDLPRGSQWLGGIYVEASGFLHAIAKAHELKANPGGCVKGWELPPERLRVLPEFTNRLLTSKEDINASLADVVQ